MRKTKRTIGFSLLAIGLILLAIPLYYEWDKQQEAAALEEAMTLISESDDGEADVSSVNNLTVPEAQLTDVMELEIPAIDLKQKILPETTEENLSVALTQIKGNQTPGEGNFTIAGHRGYRGDRHFRQLPDVPVGSEVIVHQGDQSFHYTITSSDVIAPTDTAVLNDEKNQDEITLITCTVDGKERIAVQGTLKSNGKNPEG
ncbi:class D sortase [Lentibacillus salicampi]|uniref:Class D sortase n=1 Tax=Lentibacillus salicampi TaxID=175306 RepID=A0A4Y9ACB1_9BACI|nr:class D sortase [Lentibacillus salicampi]TFJ93065.1 class D sortase [Lentibacillus salicampi]